MKMLPASFVNKAIYIIRRTEGGRGDAPGAPPWIRHCPLVCALFPHPGPSHMSSYIYSLKTTGNRYKLAWAKQEKKSSEEHSQLIHRDRLSQQREHKSSVDQPICP